MNNKVQYVVAIISVILIVAIWVITSGVSDGLRYVDARSFKITGCDLGEGGGHDQLILERHGTGKTSELMFSVNTGEVCDIDFGSIDEFVIGFYKQTMISLEVDNKTIITEDEGLAAYKVKSSFFIWGIIAFNLVALGIISLSKRLKKDSSES